ncbi:MAG: sugar phosphate isomerase/epimerase family protein [Anaerolineae bacterium]
MIALSTGSLYTYGLTRVFALAAEAGFDGIEIMVEVPQDSRDAAYLQRTAEEAGLPIVALHSPFIFQVPGWPGDQMGRLEHTVALAQALEVPLVVTHLPYRVYALVCQWHGTHPRRTFVPLFWPRREPYYHLLRSAERLADMEAESGVVIAVENMPARRFLGLPFPLYWLNNLEQLARFPHLTLDTTHVGTWGLSLLDAWRVLGKQVAHVHLSNYDGREHRLPPDGELPLGAFLERLAQDGYAGVVSVESGPDAFQAEDPAACRANLERTIAFCRAHYRVS